MEIPEEYEKFLLENLPPSLAGKLRAEYGKHEILNEGDPNCRHQKVLYVNNSFDGQAWWCDNCSRHERLGYTPGEIIRFPPKARIRTPNPDFGGEDVYSHRANKNGIVDHLLPIEKRLITEETKKQLKLFLKKHK